MGHEGHTLKVILRSSDGYSRDWEQTGKWAKDKQHRPDPGLAIHVPGRAGRAKDAVDRLQVQDLTSGEKAFFKFPCETNDLDEYGDIKI